MSSKSEVPEHLKRCSQKHHIGYTEIIKHQINTGEAKPFKLKPYMLPLAKPEAAENEINHMASRGINESSCSA